MARPVAAVFIGWRRQSLAGGGEAALDRLPRRPEPASPAALVAVPILMLRYDRRRKGQA